MSSRERMKAAFSGMAYPTYEGWEAQNRQQDKPKSELFIWLCATPLALESLSRLIKPFVQSGGIVHMGLSESAEGVLNAALVAKTLRGVHWVKDLDQKALSQHLSRCGCLLIPNMSQNMAAKLALGIQDQRGLVLTWAALGMGIKVEAVMQQIYEPSYGALGFEGTKAQRSLMTQHGAAVEQLGLKTYRDFSALEDAWRQEGRYSLSALGKGKFKGETFIELKDALGLKIITERHILSLERGSRLKIESEAKVTPLAKDAAKQRQIELLRKE